MSLVLRARVKHFLKRLLFVGLASLLGLTVLAYVVDYAVFRQRLSSNRQPFSQITVYGYDAVPQKNGKTQFIFDPPRLETCANALFPRSGYVPCWYLKRNSQPRTDY